MGSVKSPAEDLVEVLVVSGSARGAQPMPVTGPLPAAVSYVVILPDGVLQVRTVDNLVDVDEWGCPYQESLWAAVRRDVDPYLGAVNGVALAGGLRAKVADLAGWVPQLYPPNPVASAMLTTLGWFLRRFSGTIVIVGTEGDDGLTAPLTTDQLELIHTAHQMARTTVTDNA